jgi:hypothetical protein
MSTSYEIRNTNYELGREGACSSHDEGEAASWKPRMMSSANLKLLCWIAPSFKRTRPAFSIRISQFVIRNYPFAASAVSVFGSILDSVGLSGFFSSLETTGLELG